MAKSLGKEQDYRLFIKRAENYKNLYDASTGWMRVRHMDGSWETPFDSMRYDNGWVEANAVQSTWFVPHDVAGLIKLMGGKEKFTQKLNYSFVASEKTSLNRRFMEFGQALPATTSPPEEMTLPHFPISIMEINLVCRWPICSTIPARHGSAKNGLGPSSIQFIVVCHLNMDTVGTKTRGSWALWRF